MCLMCLKTKTKKPVYSFKNSAKVHPKITYYVLSDLNFNVNVEQEKKKNNY